MDERGGTLLWRALAGALLAALLVLAGCSDDDGGSESSSDDSVASETTQVTEVRSGGEVVSEILAEYEPSEAPGYTQYLYRVEIPPGASIDPHHHPGQQLARVQEGTLTYTVVEGTLEVGRDGDDVPSETVEAGTTVELEAGDTVFEAESMVHQAENQGDVPVRILLTALFESGADLSIPVDTAT